MVVPLRHWSYRKGSKNWYLCTGEDEERAIVNMVNDSLGSGVKYGRVIVKEVITAYIDVITTLLARGRIVRIPGLGYLSVEVIPRPPNPRYGGNYELVVRVRMTREKKGCLLKRKFKKYFKVTDDGKIEALEGMKDFLEEPTAYDEPNELPSKEFRMRHVGWKSPKQKLFDAEAKRPPLFDKFEVVELDEFGDPINE